jgi:hypothetical protein
MQDFVSGLLKEMETMLPHLFKGLWFGFIIVFPCIRYVKSENLVNAMTNTFNYKFLPSHQKGPKTKKCHKTLWKNMWGGQPEKSFIVYLKGALLYIIGFVKSLGWKVVSCHERWLAVGIFMWLLTLFQTHLPQFLPWWRCACQGLLLWTLSSNLGWHNRNPWPACFVPSPIHNILLVCFLLAHCDQITVRVYHNMGLFWSETTKWVKVWAFSLAKLT